MLANIIAAKAAPTQHPTKKAPNNGGFPIHIQHNYRWAIGM